MTLYTPYRRTLAWIGFITAYIIAPIAGIHALTAYTNATADRAEAFYQQTQSNH